MKQLLFSYKNVIIFLRRIGYNRIGYFLGGFCFHRFVAEMEVKQSHLESALFLFEVLYEEY